ncbi:hypothetical protein ACJMK2_034051 [Sinanodonta woodiana]|uniref:TASOR pseudo-PARP domain-containing protein n=1 Tax=Sinanodonta woodiana TaxID=1069815 RepID=A0ABD3WRQ0_SINWO
MSKQESARIPRRKTEGLLEEVKLNSPEGQSILADVKRTCFDTNYEDKFWKIEKIEIVSNFVLEKRYEDKKRELKEQGRKGKELEEHLMFLSEQGYNLSTVVKDGCKTGTKKRHVLGYTRSGVHLHRNLDILVRFMTFKNFSSPGHIIVFKSILGRSKALKPMVKSTGATFLEPTPNCDSHVSSEKVQPTMSVCEALNYTYVYFYEYDEDTGLPVVYPRHVVPYAVLTLCRLPGVIHGGPFLAIDSPNWRWEVKGETRNGFRWARVNADASDSGTKFRRGKGKKRERQMPNKDIVSLELEPNPINMGFKGQSVPRYLKNNQCTKESETSHLINAYADPAEGVCIPSEENEISNFSCSLSIAKQVTKTESFELSNINDIEKLIVPDRRRVSESRCHINNSRSADESERTQNERSQEGFDHDTFVDKLSQQSSIVATLKTSVTDDKDEIKPEEKDHKSKGSNLKIRESISLHDHSSSLVLSFIRDCPGQMHTEEIIKQAREVLLRKRSIHTSSLASIPFALINPRICLRRVDEDHLQSQQRDKGRFVVGNSSLSTCASLTKVKEEVMSLPVKNEVLTASKSDSGNQESNCNSNPSFCARKSPEHVGAFHSTTQLPREEGRSKTNTPPLVSSETSYVAGQLQNPPLEESCLDVGKSVLSTNVIFVKAKEEMSSPVKNDVNIAAESDSGSKQSNSTTDPASYARIFPAMVDIFNFSTEHPREQWRSEPRASSVFSPETSYVVGQLQTSPSQECYLNAGNSSLSTNVNSIKAEENMSSPVKNDVRNDEKSESYNKQSDSNTDPTCSTRDSLEQVGIFDSSTRLPCEQGILETSASLFVSPETSYVVGQLKQSPSRECCSDVGNSLLAASVISEKANEEVMLSTVINEVHSPKRYSSINKQSNSNTDPTFSNRKSEQVCLSIREQGRLTTSASPCVSTETSYLVGQLKQSPSKECCSDVGNSLLSACVSFVKSVDDMSSPVKNDANTADESDSGNRNKSRTDPACCARFVPEKVDIFLSSTQLPREYGKLETSTSPFVTPETSYVVGQLTKPSFNECSLDMGNISMSCAISEKAKEEDMSSLVKNEFLTAVKSDSFSQQSNFNIGPVCSVRNSPEQVGLFHSSTQLPRAQGRLETRVSPFVSLVGQLHKPLSNENCIPQNAFPLANSNVNKQSYVTDAHKANINETCVKDEKVEKGGESLCSVGTKKTDIDILSNTGMSRNFQTYITSTPSMETRIPTLPDSLGILTMNCGQNAHHVGYNSSRSMQTTNYHGTGSKYENDAHFNEPSPFQVMASSSLCRSSSSTQSASVGNRIPWSVYRSLRDNCTASGQKNISTHEENNTLHTTHKNFITDMKNPINSNLLCTEGKADKTQSITSSISSLCTFVETKAPLVCNNSTTLSNLQVPSLTMENSRSIFSPNRELISHDRQSENFINNEIVFSGDVTTLDRYIIEKAWKRLGNIKQTPEANISDNEIPRNSGVDKPKDSYPYTPISEIGNVKTSKDPRLRPRSEIHLKDTSNAFRHEIIDTDRTSKRDGNLCDLSINNVAYIGTFTEVKKGNDSNHQNQTRGSEEENSDGTPTYDERDYSAESDIIQGVGQENLSTVPIKQKETAVNIVKNMGSCTDMRINESVIADTKRVYDSDRIIATPIKKVSKEIISSSLKEKANKNKAQVKSNSSKQETKGYQVNDYQVEITKTLRELSAIINEIQSRQEQASKVKDAKSPILGDVKAGQRNEKRDVSASEECKGNMETNKSDGSTCTISERKDNNNFQSITPIHSLCSTNAHCTKSIISVKRAVSNRVKRANKSLSLIRAINKYKLLHLSETNARSAVSTPVKTLQSTSKQVDGQVSFEVEKPSPSKDQCVSSNKTALQTIIHKTEFPIENGTSAAKEKAQTQSLVVTNKASETENQCTGMMVEKCSTVLNHQQDKTPSSNVSTVISEENIKLDNTKSSDLAHKWRPIAPVDDSKPHESDFAVTPLGKCQGKTLSCSKPSTNMNKKVGVDRKSNVQVEIVLKSKHFMKDTADDKTNSTTVPSPTGTPEASTAYDLTFKYSEITSENSSKKVAVTEGDFKDVGNTCESSAASKIRSDSLSEDNSVNYWESPPYIDLSSEQESNHFSNEGVTKLPAIKDSQFASELIKKGFSCSGKDVSVAKCSQNQNSTHFSNNVGSTVRKPKVSDSSSNWKKTDASGLNTMDKKKAKVSVSDSGKDIFLTSKNEMYCVSDDKALTNMDISSNSDCSSDCYEVEKPEPIKKRESRLTDLSTGDVLRNGLGLNGCANNGGSASATKAAKTVRKQSMHHDEYNTHKKKLNKFTRKAMNRTKKQLDVYSSGLKDTNISIQESSSRVIRDGFKNIGTKTEMNENKSVHDVTKREKTLKEMNFQGNERLKLNSSQEKNQNVRGRVLPKHRFLIDNSDVQKHFIDRKIKSPASGSVRCKFERQMLAKSQNSVKQGINIASRSKDSDENEFSFTKKCNRREPFISNEKEKRERSTSTVRSSSLSSEYYKLNGKRRRYDDTKLDRNAERAVSVSSSDKHSSVSSHSRNRSLSRSVNGSRNGRESCSELSPIRDSGYIPPRYLNPNFKLRKQFVKQRFPPFHKSSQKQYIEKQKQKAFQKYKYKGSFKPKRRDLCRNERRFVDFNNVDGRLKYDFLDVQGIGLPPNGPGAKHRGNYFTDNDDKFQTRPYTRFVQLPDNTYRKPLETNFFSRKHFSGEHYATRDFDNRNDYYQSSRPLVPNGGFYDISKRNRYSNLNGRSNGFYGNRGFSMMRAKRTFDDEDDADENRNVKRRRMHAYKVHVGDTEQTANKTNSMKAKKKKKVKKQNNSLDVRSDGCEKQISVDNFPGGKSKFDVNNDKQSSKGHLEHSLYKDKFGALHERLDVRCKKQHVEPYTNSMHLSNEDQISNFDDPERSVRPRIRLRERIFDALERYRNAFESSDPSEVDEEIVRCLNFLCKKIDVSGSDSDTTDHLNRQRRPKNTHLERVLQNVHRQKVSFYEHVVNTIRVMQRQASVTNMPNSIEMVRNQVSLGKNRPTMKHQISAKMKRKRNAMNNRLKERQNQRLKKQKTYFQMKRKTNFDFVNTNFRGDVFCDRFMYGFCVNVCPGETCSVTGLYIVSVSMCGQGRCVL